MLMTSTATKRLCVCTTFQQLCFQFIKRYTCSTKIFAFLFVLPSELDFKTKRFKMRARSNSKVEYERKKGDFEISIWNLTRVIFSLFFIPFFLGKFQETNKKKLIKIPTDFNGKIVTKKKILFL